MKLIIASFFALLVLPTSIFAKVGGRCSNNWGEDCICLDKDVCRKTWEGVAYTGTRGSYPCPDDPDDIMACVIQPCPKKPKSGTTQCLWKEACKDPSKSKYFFAHPTAMSLWACSIMLTPAVIGPVCPGGNNFICCNHRYLGWKPFLQEVELGVLTVALCRLFPGRMREWNQGEKKNAEWPIQDITVIIVCIYFYAPS